MATGISPSLKAGGDIPVNLTGGQATGGTASSTLTNNFGSVTNSNGLGFWAFVLIVAGGGIWLWKRKSQ